MIMKFTVVKVYSYLCTTYHYYDLAAYIDLDDQEILNQVEDDTAQELNDYLQCIFDNPLAGYSYNHQKFSEK